MSNTADLDPSEFVQRIRLLGERDQQDAERSRKLEEDILQGRAERERKRAERARSISPEKSTTPQSRRSVASPSVTHDPSTSSPIAAMDPSSPSATPRQDAMDRLTGPSTPDSQRAPPPLFPKPDGDKIELPEPSKPSPNANALSRSGTLSWQRRPQSGSIRRPLSMVAADSSPVRSPRETPDPSASEDQPMSRDMIAQSLGSKDPSWFRQTPDRGAGSAAYRKSQEDAPADTSSLSQDEQDSASKAYNMGSIRRQLPGMSRGSTAEPEGSSSPDPDSLRSSSPSRDGSVRGSTSFSNRFSTNTTTSIASAADSKSAFPSLDSQRFSAAPSESGPVDAGDNASSARVVAMSPTQGRLSPERPASPTKGMGGFVQSAMMKRSDSVSKRWSAQAPTALSRQNSTASNRGSFAGLPASATLPRLEPRPSSLSRESSHEPSSRPSSSHSNMTITQDPGKSESEFARPQMRHSRSKSVASPTKLTRGDSTADSSPPATPSRRWSRSPTKSSWLESALNRPESPTKPHRGSISQQPAWMTELAKAKQQRGSVDLSSRSGTPQPAVTSPSSVLSKPIMTPKAAPFEGETPTKAKSSSATVENTPPAPKAKPAALSPPANKEVPEAQAPSAAASEPISEPSKPAAQDTAETVTQAEAESPAKVISPKNTLSPTTFGKPETPPKTDFRSQLKSRPPATGSPKEGLEFQNVFGKLKKTTTQNYVAPDTFKSNIMQGKAALNITGGPAPRVKRDELKESLVKQKSAMLAKAAETGSAAGKKPAAPEQAVPEALARRKTLTRKDSEGSPFPLKEKSPQEQPEALMRRKSLKDGVRPSPPDKPASPPSTFSPGKLPGKLADRFNPALAGMLARGPPPLAGSSASKTTGPGDTTVRSSSAAQEPSGEDKSLTHMTKGRAKGPKRRAPTSKTSGPAKAAEPPIETPAPKEEIQEAPRTARLPSIPLVKPQDILPSEGHTPTRPKPVQSPPLRSSSPALDSKPKPPTPVKSPDLAQKARTSLASSIGSDESAEQSKPQSPSTRSSIADRFSKEVKLPDLAPKSRSSLASSSRPEDAAEQPKPLSSSNRNSIADRFNKGIKSPDLAPKSRSSVASSPRSEETPEEPRPFSSSNRSSIADRFSKDIKSPEPGFKARSPPLFSPKSEEASEQPGPLSSKRSSIADRFSKDVKSPEIGSKPKSPLAFSPKSEEAPEQPKPLAPSNRSSIVDRFNKELKLTGVSPLSSPPSEQPPKKIGSPVRDIANRFSQDMKTDVSISPTRLSPTKLSSPPPSIASPPPAEATKPEGSVAGVSVKNVADRWQFQSGSQTPPRTGPKSPIKLPTRKDEEAAMENAGLARGNGAGVGLGIGINTSGKTLPPKPMGGLESSESSPVRKPFAKTATSGPTSPQKPLPEPPVTTAPSSEAMKLFGDRFDIPPDTSGELTNIDTQSIIASYPLEIEKIKTLRTQMQELTGDGKLTQIPIEEERVLYDESMYLCTHTFETKSGAKTTEVYLWAGASVPESNVEDAQVFARRVAKENQGKLINIRQGKETSNFFEALGGIVITRQGSKPAARQFMLCGRRHLGHLVFDEVDLSLKNLCSGFSFIVPSPTGAIFLWKGTGCNADEISGARLIGMELGTSGELIELEEGRETPAFLDLFPPLDNGSKSIPRSAEHWRYKASSDKYRPRLFRIEQIAQQRASIGGLQVSSFWPSNLLRKPSWQNIVSVPLLSPTLPQHPAPKSPVSRSASPTPSQAPVPPTPIQKIDTKVVEIAPFGQADLEADRVYVLDAFFDIYIIVGALCRSQSHAFSTALLFAHEYGILAASLEDRPFVPVSTVVLEGVPKDMKAVFRSWREDRADTGALMAGKLGRGKSLRIVGLGTALRATGGS